MARSITMSFKFALYAFLLRLYYDVIVNTDVDQTKYDQKMAQINLDCQRVDLRYYLRPKLLGKQT